MNDDVLQRKPFKGRAAIVTGATRGIGRAIALELARRGAHVAFNYAKSAEAAEELRTDIESLGVRALATQCDAAQTDAVAEMVKATKEEFGRIDFLVNNAGITRDNLILRMKEDDWDAIVDTNLKGPFFDQMSPRHGWILRGVLIHAKKQMRHHLRRRQQTLNCVGIGADSTTGLCERTRGGGTMSRALNAQRTGK